MRKAKHVSGRLSLCAWIDYHPHSAVVTVFKGSNQLCCYETARNGATASARKELMKQARKHYPHTFKR